MSEPNPPWIEFPDIAWGSVGWRMGAGEAYWNKWRQWYEGRGDIDREKYKQNWPECDDWGGFYAFIERGITPRWATEFQEKLSAPQSPPDPSEGEITDYFRVVWLVRNHLKRESYPCGVHGAQKSPKSDEDVVEFYTEPNGRVWRLGHLAKGGLRLTEARVDA